MSEATPARPRRIALIGSAPSSLLLAPYGDPNWEIWGCSPGLAPHIKRVDAWFEIHYWDPQQPQAHGWGEEVDKYMAWMQALTVPVYTFFDLPGLRRPVPYPKDEMVRKYGAYFFTSSLAWMFAHALEQDPVEIGLWGVDMSACEEWGQQRGGCHHFVQLARDRGIKVTVPAESDLLAPPPLYGAYRADRMAVKLYARVQDIERQITEQAQIFERAKEKYVALQGSRAELEYFMKTWLGADVPEQVPAAIPRAVDAHRAGATTLAAPSQGGEVLRLDMGHKQG